MVAYADDTIFICGGSDSVEVGTKIKRCLEELGLILPSLGIGMSREKSIILSEDLPPVFEDIPVKKEIGYLGFRLRLSGDWLPHFRHSVMKAKAQLVTLRKLIAKHGQPCLKMRAREIIRHHIISVLAYGLEAWGGALSRYTVRKQLTSLNGGVNKVILGIPSSANPKLAELVVNSDKDLVSTLTNRYLARKFHSREWGASETKLLKRCFGVTALQGIPESLSHSSDGIDACCFKLEGDGSPPLDDGTIPIVYTDGSKFPMDDGSHRVGAAFISHHSGEAGLYCLPSHATVQQAELVAIKMALKTINRRCMVAVDSKSALMSIRGDRSTTLLEEIRGLIRKTGAMFTWVKAHNGALYNEWVDALAKSATRVGIFMEVEVSARTTTTYLSKLGDARKPMVRLKYLTNTTITDFVGSWHHVDTLRKLAKMKNGVYALKAVFGLLRTRRYYSRSDSTVSPYCDVCGHLGDFLDDTRHALVYCRKYRSLRFKYFGPERIDPVTGALKIRFLSFFLATLERGRALGLFVKETRLG